MSSNELIKFLPPGALIYVAGSCAEPHSLLEKVGGLSEQLSNLNFIQQPLGAVNRRDLSVLVPNSTQKTFFMTPFLQQGLSDGRVSFVPMQMRNIFAHLKASKIDVAFFQASKDIDGNLRYGPNVDYLDAVLASTKKLVIEINTGTTAAQTAPLVNGDQVDLFVEAQSPPPTYPVGEPDAVSTKIGGLIADLIKDGDCLQTGIGAVPAAMLEKLIDRNDLGFHGGLMDEGVMHLIAKGNINGSRKQIDVSQHVLGMALGSEQLLDWLAHDPMARNVAFRSADYTHEVSVIGQLDNFVSINSAVEIDLMGQVNAEVTGGKQISGTGGSVDFMRSAKVSRGGRSIVAMTSTARKGTISRIVPRVGVVTALRTDVDLVVTEFGVANLRDESLSVRAQKLIEIAHPDFREELKTQI